MGARRLAKTVLFVCDLQEKFRPAIWEFPKVVSTATKLVQASRILKLPIYASTQNKQALGPTVREVGLGTSVDLTADVDKTLFSMCVPEILRLLPESSEVLIVGIEAHICVTQTTLDLLAHGHKVYVIADGVSSCNKEEVPMALRRLANEGAVVTSSESILYEIMGDASLPEFKEIIGLVKASKETTKDALQSLCKI